MPTIQLTDNNMTKFNKMHLISFLIANCCIHISTASNDPKISFA